MYKRQVRTLRADLAASLAREAELGRALHLANQRLVDDRHIIEQKAVQNANDRERHANAERKLRDHVHFMRSVASAAMRDRAADAIGVPSF